MLPLYFTEQLAYCENKAWYFRLKLKESTGRALFADYSLTDLTKKLIICWVVNYEDLPAAIAVKQQDLRLYTYFSSYIEFYYFQQKIPTQYHTFNEVILGECRQKPHFDLDIPLSTCSNYSEIVQFKNLLSTACQQILARYDVQLTTDDICFYQSHGTEKYSYHLVINHYYHDNHYEARAFYRLVRAELKNAALLECLDPAVYSKVQQFRLLYSCKPRTRRIKLPENWNNFLSRKEELTRLRTSLVSFVADSRSLPLFCSEEEREGLALKICHYEDLPIERILTMMHAQLSTAPFVFQDLVDGHILILIRQAPSLCPVCERIHEKDHPYISVDNIGRVEWFCRRHAQNQGFYLLTLTPEEMLHQTIPLSDFTFDEEEEVTYTSQVFTELQKYNSLPVPACLLASRPEKVKIRKPANVEGHLNNLTLNFTKKKTEESYLAQRKLVLPK